MLFFFPRWCTCRHLGKLYGYTHQCKIILSISFDAKWSVLLDVNSWPLSQETISQHQSMHTGFQLELLAVSPDLRILLNTVLCVWVFTTPSSASAASDKNLLEHAQRIIESLWLEKPTKIIKLIHHPITTTPITVLMKTMKLWVWLHLEIVTTLGRFFLFIYKLQCSLSSSKHTPTAAAQVSQQSKIHLIEIDLSACY